MDADGACYVCDGGSRAADEWTACVSAVKTDADVATYGWDDDACASVIEECGIVPN